MLNEQKMPRLCGVNEIGKFKEEKRNQYWQEENNKKK